MALSSRNLLVVLECLTNIRKCLNMIEDETEVRPGTKTIRGTDGGVIDVANILRAIDVARDDIRHIESAVSR